MIMMGLQFCSQLDFHHSIEEQHIFPVLAKKMPEFRKELELLSQHRQIHAGLEKLEKYLEKCRSGEEDMRRDEVKRLMDGFGKVLWTHLDQEVKTLEAANMRKYWSLDEMRRLPM
jgi:hemerythrin-like domain-containing protein